MFQKISKIVIKESFLIYLGTIKKMGKVINWMKFNANGLI